VKMQIQGKAKQMEGALQDLYADAAEMIRESASEAGDFLPFTYPVRRLVRRALGRTRPSQQGRHYRCTNTLSIVHTGRPTSIRSAKITHATMNVV
jgi:hypothetical protein